VVRSDRPARVIPLEHSDGHPLRGTGHRLTRIAALLHEKLNLRGTPRNAAKPKRFSNYGLSIEHDRRLTEWMTARLELAVWPKRHGHELAAVEQQLLDLWRPPLNLRGVDTPWREFVSSKRAAMAAEAEAWARQRGVQD
jgi:hypothetical protein